MLRDIYIYIYIKTKVEFQKLKQVFKKKLSYCIDLDFKIDLMYVLLLLVSLLRNHCRLLDNKHCHITSLIDDVH